MNILDIVIWVLPAIMIGQSIIHYFVRRQAHQKEMLLLLDNKIEKGYFPEIVAVENKPKEKTSEEIAGSYTPYQWQ